MTKKIEVDVELSEGEKRDITIEYLNDLVDKADDHLIRLLSMLNSDTRIKILEMLEYFKKQNML